MTRFIEFLMENWTLIVSLSALAVVVVIGIKKFLQMSTDKQKEAVRKCLLGWVIDAERDLGGGTGKVKLSTVYGIFVKSFPVIKNFISFETFSKWVDEALEEMREMLENNENLKMVVEGAYIEVEELVGEINCTNTENKE